MRKIGRACRSCAFPLTIAAGVMVGLALLVRGTDATLPVTIDETIYLWQAEHLTSGRLTVPVPRFPQFVGCPFILVRDDRRFGLYPIGYLLAVALWVKLGAP